ncbi:MAG: GNAT family N-acetyltransferase, partial [Thermoleophilia bacterium]|nr:GNAT family N-acetyltransferase [Thermoleophilia bacterium]
MMHAPDLPAGYSTRLPTGSDAADVLHIVGTCEAAEGGKVQIDLEDILSDWRRPGFDVASDGVFVVDKAGAPAGYAELFAGRAEGTVLPAHCGRGIGIWL